MARVFKAQYTGGHCPECEDPIMKGEEVSYAADKSLLHAECNPASTYDDGWDEDDD